MINKVAFDFGVLLAKEAGAPGRASLAPAGQSPRPTPAMTNKAQNIGMRPPLPGGGGPKPSVDAVGSAMQQPGVSPGAVGSSAIGWDAGANMQGAAEQAANWGERSKGHIQAGRDAASAATAAAPAAAASPLQGGGTRLLNALHGR